MSKRILVIAGNPKQNSFSNHLAKIYADAAEHNSDLRLMSLSDMNFNPDLTSGYDQEQALEDALLEFQRSINWANHLVLVTPLWWGFIPAKLKGLFDRAFLPGFAFKYEEGKSVQTKLLINKTSRIIITMDTPPWYYRFVLGAPALKQLKTSTLEFVGFNSVKHNYFGPLISSTDKSRNEWIKTVARLGAMGQ